jgi:hypothetical protein
MLAELSVMILRWMRRNATGNIIRAHQRYGKTTAIRHTVDILRSAYPGILVYSPICRSTLRPSEKAFFERLLFWTENMTPCDGTAAKMRDRLSDFLIQEAERSGQNKIVFCFDEAQKLWEAQYDWMIDVHNELRNAQIDVTVFLFGQNELVDQRTRYRARSKDHIYGRFMREEFEMKGLCNVKEMEHCLTSYDDPEVTCYPRGSGWCYTRYYFPEAYALGWRLQQLAGQIWTAYEEVRAANGDALPHVEVSMESFFSVVGSIFIDIGDRKESSPRISADELASMVVESGYGSAPPADPGIEPIEDEEPTA